MLRPVIAVVIVTVGLLLSACIVDTRLENSVEAPIFVDSVEVISGDGGEYTALAQGHLPDSCTSIAQVEQEVDGTTINVTLIGARPADQMCAQMLTPFEESIPLDVEDLEAGTYLVVVNGASTTFNYP